MRTGRLTPKKPKELDFLVSYHSHSSKGYTTAQVCDYPSVRSGDTTLRLAHHHVIRRPIITIKFDYPLGGDYKLTFCRPTGFTYLDLMACVYKGYCKIYRDIRKYGVWGHSFSNLYLEGFIINGPGDYSLAMGS